MKQTLDSFLHFFSPIHRVISFSLCLVLEEQWVYLVPWPLGALGAGSELTKAERPICPGLSSCLSCALMALAAILGEVARFMLVKHGSVRLKGHVGGCCLVFHRDFQEGVSAPRKWTNMTESWSVCLPAVTQQASVNSVISTVVSLTRWIDPAEMSQCGSAVITPAAVHTKSYTPG